MEILRREEVPFKVDFQTCSLVDAAGIANTRGGYMRALCTQHNVARDQQYHDTNVILPDNKFMETYIFPVCYN